MRRSPAVRGVVGGECVIFRKRCGRFGLVPKLPLRLSQVKVSNARGTPNARSKKRSFEKLRSQAGAWERGNQLTPVQAA